MGGKGIRCENRLAQAPGGQETVASHNRRDVIQSGPTATAEVCALFLWDTDRQRDN